MTKPGAGDDFYRVNGAGEMLVFSAADFEDFLVPRPDMVPVMESELKAVIRHLVENRWPFRLHTTYNETIERALNVYEEVNREIPFDGLHWFFDHCETITDRNIERVKALGGGIAVQNRMAFQGEYFVERYGAQQAKRTPPIRRMLEIGRSGWGWHRRNARLKLQPVPFAVLAYNWQDHRRSWSVSGRKSARSGGSAQALHDGQQLVFNRRR
jgi:predicted amidohydrolase YtcJ